MRPGVQGSCSLTRAGGSGGWRAPDRGGHGRPVVLAGPAEGRPPPRAPPAAARAQRALVLGSLLAQQRQGRLDDVVTAPGAGAIGAPVDQGPYVGPAVAHADAGDLDGMQQLVPGPAVKRRSA